MVTEEVTCDLGNILPNVNSLRTEPLLGIQLWHCAGHPPYILHATVMQEEVSDWPGVLTVGKVRQNIYLLSQILLYS